MTGEIHDMTNWEEKPLKTLNLPFNTNGRDFVIGDLHGAYDLLMQKLHDVSFDKYNDRLFSVGDLIDRGPKSFECLKLIEKPWFNAVSGNHEQMLVESLTQTDKFLRMQYASTWLSNGGDWYKDVPITDLMYWVRLAKDLPISIKVGEGDNSFGICHSDPTSDWNDMTNPDALDNILWGRSRIESMYPAIIKNIGHVYCGHTPRKEVVELGNIFFIDTYACWPTGKLTMIEVK